MTQTELLAIPQCQVKWTGQPSYLEITDLKEVLTRPERKWAVEDIWEPLERVYDIPRQIIQSKSRYEEIVLARTVFVWCHWKLTGAALIHTGRLLNRDHATIIASRKRFEMLYSTERHFRKLFDELCDVMCSTRLKDSVRPIHILA